MKTDRIENTKNDLRKNSVFGKLCMNLTWFEFSYARRNNRHRGDVTASFDL